MNKTDQVAPPDLLVSAPSFRLPSGATDCHAHVFESRFPLSPTRSYTPAEASISNYINMLQTLGFERAVLVQPSVYGTDNTSILTCMRETKSGIRYRGVAVVPPDIDDKQLESLHKAGIRGVRMNLLFQGGINKAAIHAIAPRIADLGWHVQLLVDVSIFDEIDTFIQALPVPVVIDHMGHAPAHKGIDQAGFLSLLRALDGGDTWVKLSGAYRLTPKRLPCKEVNAMVKTLLGHTPERMLFGTDWPHPATTEPMPNDTDLLNMCALWIDNKQVLQSVFVTNPKTLYQF